jgi:acetyl esterase
MNLLLAASLILTVTGAPALAAELPPLACEPDPAIQEVLEKVKQAGNPLDSLSRENAAQLWRRRELDAKKTIRSIPLASVRDVAVPARNHQIPVRIYQPARKKGKLPTLVFFHGGGWTLGSIAAYDSLARALASRASAMVISVDYRLAPEFPFPAGLDDAQLAFEWVVRNLGELGGDSARLGVAGDSGGGNLATVVARKARQEGIPLKLQALFYPSVDLSNLDRASHRANGEGRLLTKKSLETFRDLYTPNEQERVQPDVSPLFTADAELAKLPRTYLLVLGCDPLRDEGLAYGERLSANGVPVTTHVDNSMVHGFLNFYNGGAAPAASRAAEPLLDGIAKWLRDNFAR